MILALDTSTYTMTLALVELEPDESGQFKVIAERSWLANRNHSILLVSEIGALLEEAGKTMNDVKAIATGQGPGSYTGVRIGVTVAKTLAWSLDIPLVGVSSLAALALGEYDRQSHAEQAKRWFVPCIDARRGHAYSAVFAASADGFHRVKEDKKRYVADWVQELEAEKGEIEQIVFVGEVDRLDQDLFADSSREQKETIVEARHIGQLGAERLHQGEREAVHAFIPNYTQQAEAEVKFLTPKKHKGLR